MFIKTFLSLALGLCSLVAQVEASIKIQGSTTVGPIVVKAAEVLKSNKAIDIIVDTFGGSAAGLSSLASGTAQFGMISKEISEGDKAKYSDTHFTTHLIGSDAVALVVSKKLYDQGVKSLSLSQARDIYEKKVTNWKEVGGPDQKIIFLNKEPGRGTWEVFAKAIYGKVGKAPTVSHLEVGSNEEAKSKVISTPGALTQLSVAWAEKDSRVKALGLSVDGKLIQPDEEHIRAKEYPMARNLYLVSSKPLNEDQKALLDFLYSNAGQNIVEDYGYLRVSKNTN
ncbi:MAG: ABC transporter [Deltaproteobacteria bacterium CG11_big_fil_rev_8_21_14_0_20_45_16]|nr:MAG: ABC transporter [Deltaproteobacteria bacterium CG11_big_fil_rev_8_21_14_0_20_45_16]